MSNISNPCLTTKVSVYKIPGPGSVCLLYLHFPSHFYFPMFLQLPNAVEGTFATRKILLQFTCIAPNIWQLFPGEFLGTFILVLTVTCNILGNSQTAALSIACSLSAMIYALGDTWIPQRWPTCSRERAMTRGQWRTA